MLLAGKTAIIVGIGPGLGEALALEFAAHGANLVLGSRSSAGVTSLTNRIESAGSRAIGVHADITQPDECVGLATAAAEAFGSIDVLVNNAVQYGSNRLIESTTSDEWRSVFEVNVFGTLNACRAVIPMMKAQGNGSIVLVNTQLIRQFNPDLRPQGEYAASKGALEVAARHLAGEVGAHGIRVNSIVPGYIWGPRLEGRLKREAAESGRAPSELYEVIARRLALRKIPTSADVALAAVFFASDLSRAVTGQSLDVNGGEYMK